MLFSASIVSARSFLAQNDRARADSRARSSSREKVEKKVDPCFVYTMMRRDSGFVLEAVRKGLGGAEEAKSDEGKMVE
jgi:hypothetical protein